MDWSCFFFQKLFYGASSVKNDKALNSGIYKQSVPLADFQSIYEIR